MNKTGIQYLTHTWNPVAMRCSRVSPGCDNCWHLAMAKRHAANHGLPLEMRQARAGGPPVLLAGELEAPSRLRKPARIGVQFMGDLFHEDVPFDTISDVFNVMCDARTDQHTFQVLTKRPQRAQEWLDWLGETEPGDTPLSVTLEVCGHFGRNVWFGVTAENDKYLWRIEKLLKIPAAVRYVSYEPALGPVRFGLATDCDRNCSEYQNAECPGTAGKCIM